MKIFKILFTLITVSTLTVCCYGQNESFYNAIISQKLNGQREVKVDNGVVDIVTDEYAIETEWADNWKHSIGQSLWYALQTNKKAGIVLIMKNKEDFNQGIRLQTAIDYANLTDKIKVWIYPEDFNTSFQEVSLNIASFKSDLISQKGNHTRNKNSGIRHNSNCTYFACGNCVPCGPNEGKKACGKCGG